MRHHSTKATDYSKKYKNLDSLIEHYKPIRFKFLGLERSERLPYFPTVLQPIVFGYLRFRNLLGLPVSYFDLRFTLSPQGRKVGDMRFITHYVRNHGQTGRKAATRERIRYHLIKLQYLPELAHINSILRQLGTSKSPDQPQADLYMLRWAYLLDVTPSFDELVHGTDLQTALYVLGNF